MKVLVCLPIFAVSLVNGGVLAAPRARQPTVDSRKGDADTSHLGSWESYSGDSTPNNELVLFPNSAIGSTFVAACNGQPDNGGREGAPPMAAHRPPGAEVETNDPASAPGPSGPHNLLFPRVVVVATSETTAAAPATTTKSTLSTLSTETTLAKTSTLIAITTTSKTTATHVVVTRPTTTHPSSIASASMSASPSASAAPSTATLISLVTKLGIGIGLVLVAVVGGIGVCFFRKFRLTAERHAVGANKLESQGYTGREEISMPPLHSPPSLHHTPYRPSFDSPFIHPDERAAYYAGSAPISSPLSIAMPTFPEPTFPQPTFSHSHEEEDRDFEVSYLSHYSHNASMTSLPISPNDPYGYNSTDPFNPASTHLEVPLPTLPNPHRVSVPRPVEGTLSHDAEPTSLTAWEQKEQMAREERERRVVTNPSEDAPPPPAYEYSGGRF